MRQIAPIESPTNAVMALFPSSAVSFRLAKGATLADIADSFDRISDQNTRMPIAIFVTFGVMGLPISILRSAQN